MAGKDKNSWTITVLHLVLLVIGIGLIVRYDTAQAGKSVRRLPTRAELGDVFGEGEGWTRESDSIAHWEGTVARGDSRVRLAVVSTTELAPSVKGYVDEINLLAAVDEHGTITAVRLLASRETPAYMRKVIESGFLEKFIGQSAVSGPGNIDAVTGATITSEAIRHDLTAAARLAASRVFHLPAPEPAVPSWAASLHDPRIIAVLIALAVVLFARFSKWPKKGRKETAWVVSLVLIGIYAMTPYTLVHTFQLMRLDLPGPGNALLIVLASFVVITTVLFGPLWCGYACPFGALQELLAKLPARRWRVTPKLMRYARETRYLVLFFAVAGAFGVGIGAFGQVEPFGHLFARTRDPWAWAFILTVLGTSVFVRRFWCRFFCPTGACLVMLSSHRRWLHGVQRGVDDAAIDRPDRDEEEEEKEEENRTG